MHTSSPEHSRVVCTDHDGTLTESEKEMAAYEDIVTTYNAERLGISTTEVTAYLHDAKQVILAAPEKFGWKFGTEELVVAAATSDHYIFFQVATQIMLQKLSENDLDLKQKIDLWGGPEQYTTEMFFSCSPKLPTFYRPEAKDFLEGLHAAPNVRRWAVVTNSDATKVAKKLETLQLSFTPTVIGGAKKFVVNREWVGVLPTGAYKEFPGFPSRGVELQREVFHRTLLEWCGEEFPQLVFVEDVAEFVLWLDYLAQYNVELSTLRTALVLTQMTPQWEREYYTNGSDLRYGSQSLLSILHWIRNLK